MVSEPRSTPSRVLQAILMVGELEVMQSHKESCFAQGIVVVDTSKAARKGSRGRDKFVFGEPMVELEKRLARVALQVAVQQERMGGA